MARTHARVSRSLKSTLPRSWTALANEARTLAERTSYCCAPASATHGSANTSAAASERISARRLAAFREPRADVARGFGYAHPCSPRVPPRLRLDHAFLEPPLADHATIAEAGHVLVAH